MTQPATILVVDDTDGQRYAVTHELKRSGFRVIEAASGIEALTSLRQNPDVVLLDVKLPDLSGFEVCRRIKDDELTARIPVIQTSANFTTSESKAEGLESGADAYLAQPFSTLELVATVNAVLRVRNAEAERERLLVELKAAAAAESRARAEAESAARRANSILESMGDAFFTLDRNWRFTYLNSQAERILRRPKDQLLGRTLWDEFPLAIGSIFEQNYRRVAETQARASFEAFYEPFNTWVEVRAYPTADGLAVYFYDISARKQSEARLRQATERLAERTELLNSLLANAPVGFAFFDREYRYVRVNKFLAEINGISIADHLGKSIVELLPVAAKAVVPTLDHVFQHAEPVADLEVAGETPAQPGVTRYWHTGFYPVFGPDGAVQHVGAIVLEVTAQKLAENALRESEERLQLAQMAAGAGSWEWFIGTERVVLMPECLVLWGFDEQPTLRDVIDRIVEEDRTATERALRRAARGEGDFQAEFRIALPDGATRWIEGKGRLVAASANKPAKIIGINLDITERKLAEEVLIRTEKLASVGRLAATVAHEINNPLEAIMNAVYLAQTDPSISDEGRRQLAIADEEIVRAAHITRQTLGFYRENAAAVEVNIG
ncbi:MAG TPA: PAS domain-containing protein, partial [Candidatus Nanoarchaeia archaeon]|nr:PAS domain-containing protein [Candidatus Nanoarchaeia archaeon]